MNEATYNRDTIDAKLELIHEAIKAIDLKVSYTNGKVRRHEKVLIVVGTAIVVLLIVNGSPFVDFAKALAGI